jgi:uncharacterized protein
LARGRAITQGCIDFFEEAIELQQLYRQHKIIRNSIQTNGVLIDETWCTFFAKYQFTVGLSLDGPQEIHDHARVDKTGDGTFHSVMSAITLLKKYQIEFNILVTVTHQVSCQELSAYLHVFKINWYFSIQFNSTQLLRTPTQSAQKSNLVIILLNLNDISKNNLTLSSDTVHPEDHAVDFWLQDSMIGCGMM